MIQPGTVCRIIRLSGLFAAANNRFVTATGSKLALCRCGIMYDVEPHIPVGIVQGFPKGAVICGVCSCHLQPISDPPTCALTDAQVRRRGPVPIESPSP